MGESVSLASAMKIFCGIFSIILLINRSHTDPRQLKQLSLFSVVQFPNDECTSSSDSSTLGTCLTSSECGDRSGGTSDGSCAAGFGVCCVVSSSTCGASLSSNISYIRNPGYPSAYTPTSAGTCEFTISKANDGICQLRLDFQTMTGYTVGAGNGECTTTSFEATGQTSFNPPKICGTNTGYHMYVEFGATSTDKITLKHTLDTTSKSWNILARQISCTASWKAPTDCVQYYTGISGNVKSYNFAGAQILQSQNYDNCIRQEKGYCKIQWQQNSATTPDSFQLDILNNAAATTAANGPACIFAYVSIPDSSLDGVTGIDPGISPAATFYNRYCGIALGPTAATTATSMTSARTPFSLGVWSAAAAQNAGPGNSGFSLDYTQHPC